MDNQDEFDIVYEQAEEETQPNRNKKTVLAIVGLSLIGLNYIALIIFELQEVRFASMYFLQQPFITMILIYSFPQYKKINKNILFFGTLICSLLLVVLYQYVKRDLSDYLFFAIFFSLFGLGVFGFFLFRMTLFKIGLSDVKHPKGKAFATLTKILLDVVMIIALYIFTGIASLIGDFISSTLY